MEKKLLVLDIDGTLVNSQKEITPKTKEAVLACMEKGHACMLASGRPLPGMEWAAGELEFERFGGYLLSFNGARIIKFDTKEVLVEKKLPLELLPVIYDYAVEHGCGLVSYDDRALISANGINQYVEIESHINRMPIVEVPDFPHYFKGAVNKCLLCTEPGQAERAVPELQKLLGDGVEVYRSEPFFVEIVPKGVDKAAAIDQMLPILGIARENVIACGDGFNDCSMIRYAGVGVAMGNAQQAVKEAADVITGTNDEDGLVPIIEKYFL